MGNNKSQRIKIDLSENTDKYLKIKLEQDIEQLEFLSLKLKQEDIYNSFNADFGVVVGRVIANGGVGVPNAKLSIFIPISEEDKSRPDIYSIYPYESPRDKNKDGKRYNLLPRTKSLTKDGAYKPRQPFGSFPSKEEISTNETLLEIYEKYYKFTTTTNDSGDYMLFGVPVGLQTVHMSVDLTDIGQYSMTPASMVTDLGYSPNLFIENNTKIKPSNDLADLPHIETQEISVNVLPFWGDEEIFDIGITRQDFRIRAVLVNVFYLFGSAFTDGSNHMWGGGNTSIRNLYKARNAGEHLYMISKRNSIVTENFYYYPPEISDTQIENAVNDDEFGYWFKKLDSNNYTSFKRDGDFVYIISCNRKKVITDELGNQVEVDSSNPNGIFTEFKGFMTIEYSTDDLPMDFSGSIGSRPLTPLRYKFKIPQHATEGKSFGIRKPNVEEAKINTAHWRHQHFTFKSNKVYSVSKFNGLTPYGDDINKVNSNSTYNVGLIFSEIPSNLITEDDNIVLSGESTPELPSNGVVTTSGGDIKAFGANWLNFSIHFPQIGRLNPTVDSDSLNDNRSTTHFTIENKTDKSNKNNYYNNNNQKFVAGEINTKLFARSDLHWTDFIEVDLKDLDVLYELSINGDINKGFDNDDIMINGYNLNWENYRNGVNAPSWGGISCPYNGGKINGIPTNNSDPNIYFYRGWNDSDCIKYIKELGIL